MNEIKLFRNKDIRTYWDERHEQWLYSLIDIMRVLSGSKHPARYWSDLKRKLKRTEPRLLKGLLKVCKLKAKDGKYYWTDCASSENVLRLLQSVPSVKAEPFKQWLAKAGNDRLEEIRNPEMSLQRTWDLYLAHGYGSDWIEKRLRSIAIRHELTEEWRKRGIEDSQEYAALSRALSKTVFGMTPTEHRLFKGLSKENLRDHMTGLELLFAMMAESAAVQIAKARNAQGFQENKRAVRAGGVVARQAIQALELASGQKVISEENYLAG